MKTADTKTKTPKEYLQGSYCRLLVPDESGGYTAEIVELPGCYSQGDTAEEAIRNLEEAGENWIAAALEQGQGIPEPTGDYDYSGKIALRLPRSTHRKAIQLAERDSVSLNTFLVDAVSARIGAETLFIKWEANFNRHLATLETRIPSVTTTDVWTRVLDYILKDSKQTTSGSSPFPANISYQLLEVKASNG